MRQDAAPVLWNCRSAIPWRPERARAGAPYRLPASTSAHLRASRAAPWWQAAGPGLRDIALPASRQQRSFTPRRAREAKPPGPRSFLYESYRDTRPGFRAAERARNDRPLLLRSVLFRTARIALRDRRNRDD